MNKSDARRLNPATQNYLRQQAIRLHQEGKRIVDIAEYLGVHRNTVSDWWYQYQQEATGCGFCSLGEFVWKPLSASTFIDSS